MDKIIRFSLLFAEQLFRNKKTNKLSLQLALTNINKDDISGSLNSVITKLKENNDKDFAKILFDVSELLFNSYEPKLKNKELFFAKIIAYNIAKSNVIVQIICALFDQLEYFDNDINSIKLVHLLNDYYTGGVKVNDLDVIVNIFNRTYPVNKIIKNIKLHRPYSVNILPKVDYVDDLDKIHGLFLPSSSLASPVAVTDDLSRINTHVPPTVGGGYLQKYKKYKSKYMKLKTNK